MNSKECAELEEKLAQDELDAKRYRWLRDLCTPEDNPQHTWIVEAPSDMWDKAIDDAMGGVESDIFGTVMPA